MVYNCLLNWFFDKQRFVSGYPATIAQLVEQRTENPRVAGSIPARGTNKTSGSSSVVEHRLAKARVASSNLVFRSKKN